MAPNGKGSLLELCTTTTTMGNSIAVHLLDYLSTAKSPPNGFEDLALDFLETSRILIAVKVGLGEAQRSKTQFPPDINNELRERIRQTNTAFGIMDQMLNKYRDNEKKQGLGKIGKGFRMMFAETEIEKMKRNLHLCRDGLGLNALAFPSSPNGDKSDAAGGIGYTALAAVLEPFTVTKQRARQPAPAPFTLPVHNAPLSPTSTISPVDNHHTQPLPPVNMSGTYVSPLTSPPSLPYPKFMDQAYPERRSSVGTSLTAADSGKVIMTSHVSDLGSMTGVPRDDISFIASSVSAMPIDEMIHAQIYDGNMPLQAIRLKADPRTAPRWTPKRSTGTVSQASKQGLLSAVQQRDHKTVEHLLDCGVPPDGEPDHNLLRVAIASHDIDSVRLLLLFGADANARDSAGFSPLYTATLALFVEAAQMLLRYGADPNLSAGQRKESPLAASLSEGKEHFAQLYLKHGAETDIVMDNGNTPFIQAIESGPSTNLIELMVMYDADVNAKNSHGETALFKAINCDRLDLVNFLLDHGADPNLPGPKHMLWPSVHKQKILETLLEQGADLKRAPGILELATSINSVEAVSVLLKHGADPNVKKDGIYTPLCSAIRDNHENLVELLLAAGADPNLAALDYPIFKCVTYHRAHLLPRLLKAGANPNHPKGVIEVAVEHNDMASLKYLLDRGVSANERSTSGHTALTTAIRKNRAEMTDILLSHGASPAIRGHEWPITMAVKHPEILAKLLPHVETVKINKGALETAVVADQLESVKLLLAKGVDVEEKNGGVFSPLTTSIREDRKTIFRYLLDEAGADPNSPGEHLPIIKAIRRHRSDDVSYIQHLLERGADMNLMYRGWNAVLQTLENGETEIFKLLADSGSPDLTAMDENGRTVLEIMQERGMKAEVKILLGGRSPSPSMTAALSQLRDMVRQ